MNLKTLTNYRLSFNCKNSLKTFVKKLGLLKNNSDNWGTGKG